ncbi:MAG: Asp23/Gls24 family envelope stress response protein [Coriobacteriia bacterium]|jgi:uncharacterized alkaline shock family protein YloU|nr:Asp23/Gls24 family envelope stress response protein [Coriobacteriia bacterium]MDR2714544.1 Asp23/Gls24 family envelope stress response protein [Coriobacteriales bacterium]
MEQYAELSGFTIAPGVIETIVGLAASEVEGVAQVGSPQTPGNLIASLSKRHPTPGIFIYGENDQVIVDVHVQVLYGYRLVSIAADIREAVADALESQVSIDVSEVNVTVDGIQFAG